MTPEQKQALADYADCKAMIKEAEEKMKTLEEVIRSFAEVDEKYDLGYATISMVKGRTTWQYSEELSLREEKIKEDQKIEQQTGIAIPKEGKPYLITKFKD